ncbi:MAG: hypothetical protein J0L53_18120 [Spirochaetes bacterium]|nr:hypothetical protein [Spirochaetota bacterium]
MKYIHPLRHRKTSVSLPHASYRRLCAGRKIFARNGLRYSEQEIYRRLFKLLLKNWRGRGLKSNGLRRYNSAGMDFEVHPLYVNQVLYAALWQRALHSGESISRMLDLAIRVYLPQLLESLLSVPAPGLTLRRNTHYWMKRYGRRKQQPDFFINYQCQTRKNDQTGLEYSQSMQIITKIGLSPMQIWHLLHTAA